MALCFVLDEQLRGHLRHAIRQYNAAGINPIDAVWVGEPADLALGSKDPEILHWAERNGRILVSHDKSTMPAHLLQHLQSGRHVPGVLMIRNGARIDDVVDELTLIAHAGFPDD